MTAAPLRVLVVDDEALARARLCGLVDECPQPVCRVVGEAASAAQALAWLAAQPDGCDVALLDIRMPGRDGLQLAAEWGVRAAGSAASGRGRAPAVVFVTAHAEHALKAFELDAADYLTKPVRRERLYAALLRVAQRLEPGAALALAAPPAERAPAAMVPASGAPPAVDIEAAVIVVNDRGRLLRVPVAEVLYLKAELKYVTLRTATHSHLLDDALSDLAQRLGERFIRVHRNALVARDAVRELRRRVVVDAAADDEGGEGWAVRVAPSNEWLAVSRRQVMAVREALAAGGL